mgnify:FL=1
MISMISCMQDRLINIFICLLIGITTVNSQELVVTDSVQIELDGFSVDALEQVWVWEDDVITKLGPGLDTLFQQSIKINGTISQIDASYPLRVLIFYQDQLLLQIMDNTLSEQGDPVDFSRMDLFQVQQVTQAANSEFWVYEQENFEFLRYDRNQKETIRSGNMVQLTGNVPHISSMIDFSGDLIVADSTYGVYELNRFGALINSIPIEGALFASRYKEVLYVLTRDELVLFPPVKQPLRVSLGNIELESFFLHNGKLYTYHNGILRSYKLRFKKE